MQVHSPASENIAGAASTPYAFAHVLIAAGVPLAAMSLLSSLSMLCLRVGRSRPPRQCICGLGPSPRVLLLPNSSNADNKVRIALGSGRRGISLIMGGADTLFAPALILLPLLAI
jgi:hypothetical protein